MLEDSLIPDSTVYWTCPGKSITVPVFWLYLVSVACWSLQKQLLSQQEMSQSIILVAQTRRWAQTLCDHSLFLSLPGLDFSWGVCREFPGQTLFDPLNDINLPTAICSAVSLQVHYLPTSFHLCLFTKNKNKDSSKINLLEPHVMLLSLQTY